MSEKPLEQVSSGCGNGRSIATAPSDITPDTTLVPQRVLACVGVGLSAWWLCAFVRLVPDAPRGSTWIALSALLAAHGGAITLRHRLPRVAIVLWLCVLGQLVDLAGQMLTAGLSAADGVSVMVELNAACVLLVGTLACYERLRTARHQAIPTSG